MPVLARFIDCTSTLHSPQDFRALLTYLTTSGLLYGRRNNCARTTSGMTVTIDSGELNVSFTKTGQQPIWAHVVVSDSQTVTFDPGSGSDRFDALVLEIINEGACPASATDAQNGASIGRFKGIRGSSASAMSDNDITTDLGHSNWYRMDDVNIPAAATQFGGGGSDASLVSRTSNVGLSDNAKAALLTFLSSTASGKGASQIGVQDTGGRFTATNVEDVLAEMYDQIPPPSEIFKYGDGSDGALNVTSGTTTINCSGLGNIIVKQYTSFNVSVGATLNFSNVPSSGIIFVPLVQGNFTLAGTLDLEGCGSAGGAGVSASRSTDGATATNGNDAALPFNAPSGYLLGLKGTGQTGTNTNLGSNACGASAGGNMFAAGVASSSTSAVQGTSAANAAASPTLTAAMLALLSASEGFALIPGSGGGSAGVGIRVTGLTVGSITATTPDGGDGGGCLYAAVGGNFSFTGILKLSGTSPGNSSVTTVVTATQYTVSAGGSAGGAPGAARAIVKGTVTNSGTVQTNAGTGGTAASATNASNQASVTNGASASATSPGLLVTQVY